MHGGNIYENKVSYDFSVNINPLGINENVKNAILNGISNLENYPEIGSNKLCKEIGNLFSVSENEVVCGNGASELIYAIMRSFNISKLTLISPSFSGYENAADSLNIKINYFNLNESDDFIFTDKQVENLLNQLKSFKPDLLILTNPNNPNGALICKNHLLKILDFCKEKNILVLIDECFIELTEKSKDLSFVNDSIVYDNLIVLRAFTKSFAIPGIRLGYCICKSENILKIKKQLPEWNVSVLAQIAGLKCIEKINYLDEAKKVICKERNFLENELKLLGFKVFHSDANFVLFKIPIDWAFSKTIVYELKEKLLKKEILIRDCSDYKSLNKGFYRIAVKKHCENELLIKNIKIILEENNERN